jgi:hypothetical protein
MPAATTALMQTLDIVSPEQQGVPLGDSTAHKTCTGIYRREAIYPDENPLKTALLLPTTGSPYAFLYKF